MSFLKQEQLDAVNQVSLKALTSVHKHSEQQDFQNTISWISCVTGFCSDDCKVFSLSFELVPKLINDSFITHTFFVKSSHIFAYNSSGWNYAPKSFGE